MGVVVCHHARELSLEAPRTQLSETYHVRKYRVHRTLPHFDYAGRAADPWFSRRYVELAPRRHGAVTYIGASSLVLNCHALIFVDSNLTTS